MLNKWLWCEHHQSIVQVQCKFRLLSLHPWFNSYLPYIKWNFALPASTLTTSMLMFYLKFWKQKLEGKHGFSISNFIDTPWIRTYIILSIPIFYNKLHGLDNYLYTIWSHFLSERNNGTKMLDIGQKTDSLNS